MVVVPTTEAPSPHTAPLMQHQLLANEKLCTILAAAKQIALMDPSPSPKSSAKEPTTHHVPASPSPTPLTASTTLRKPRYKTTLVLLTPPDLTALRLPLYYPRDSNRRHVEQLKTSLLHDGVDDENGFVAFCGEDTNRKIVRGAQLLQAFCELYESGRFRYVMRDEAIPLQHHRKRLGYNDGVFNIGKIKCAFLERIDEDDETKVVQTPFNATETLLLAAHYNSKHGHVRPMNMLDNITLAQRFILCRLRDMSLYEHLESSRRRSVPPNIIWSKLSQFIAEATACNLIPYSTTQSAPSQMDMPPACNTHDPAVWRQHIRTIRERQAVYIRLAMTLLWSPHSQDLIMNKHTFEGNTISCSLWSLRTFRLRPFTSADDPVQFVMLLAMYRCQQERRTLRLRSFDRDKTKIFLQLINDCVQKMLSCAMNRTKPPFPTKWDIFNAVTTITTAPPTIHPTSTCQQHQQQRVTIADILMSLLTRWEHLAPLRNTEHGCTSENILFSLQCFMQRWPFNRKWRFLSPSLPCFQPHIFLQPLLPLYSIQFWPVSSLSALHHPPVPTINAPNPTASLPAQHNVHTTALAQRSLIKSSSSIAPRPVRLATLLPAIDDRTAPLAAEIPPALLRPRSDPCLIQNITSLPLPPTLQKTIDVVAAARGSDSCGTTQNSDPPNHDVRNGTSSRADAEAPPPSLSMLVDEELLDSGEARQFVDGSDEDGERTDADGVYRKDNDDNNSTDTDPVDRARRHSTDNIAQRVRSKQTDNTDAMLSQKRRPPEHAQNRTVVVQNIELRKNKRRKQSNGAITPTAQRVQANNDEDVGDVDDDSNDTNEEEEDLEPFYDKICAELPAPTGVTNLPIACHSQGAWNRYLHTADVSQLTVQINARCAALYYSLQHRSEGNELRDWPSIVGQKAYYNTRNRELDNNGYTVLCGILGGTEIAKDADSVINHFAKMWKGERRYTPRQQHNSVWRHIFNCGNSRDPKYANNGIGRYSVAVKDMVDKLIENHSQLFKKRLRVETAIGFLIDQVVQDKNTESPLKFPVTGSRLLFQTRHAQPQLPHFDFGNVEFNEEDSPWRPPSHDLSYFAMLTGADGFHLRIWRDGHRMMYGPFDLVRKIAATLRSEMVYIPPYSVLIVRGDLPHAGVGGAEADGPENPSSPNNLMHIRFHIYVARNIDRLKDGVYVARYKFKVNDIDSN